MIRSIKALGLALLALAAFSAFAAGSAQAAAGEVHITTEPNAVITATGENEVLKIGTSEVKCRTGKLEGTVQDLRKTGQITSNDITVTANYPEKVTHKGIENTQNCEFVTLGANASVRMNGCQYTLKGTAELTAEAAVVNCTSGKTIEIIAAGGLCTITIGNQVEIKEEKEVIKFFTHVTFTNNSEQAQEKHHLQDHVTVHGFTYTRDGAFCPQGEAQYEGTTTIKAFQDAGTKLVQDPVTKHQYTEHLCGTEVGILGT